MLPGSGNRLRENFAKKAFQFDLPSNFKDIGKLTLFPLPL
jgi:hypothetical protein